MYKFATISNGIVTNIIESNDYESINMLKQYNEEVIMANNRDVEIGFIWDGDTFYKDPLLVEKENKIVEKNSNKMLEEKQTLYDQLSVKESLSDEEQETLDLLKLDLE
jgi:hypothetical protein